MPDPLFSPALAAIHRLLGARGESAGEREVAACADRVMARMRAELEVVPALAAEHGPRWRELADRASGATTNTAALSLFAAAGRIEHGISSALAAGDEPSRADWFAPTAAALADYTEALETMLPKPAPPNAAKEATSDVREALGDYLTRRYPELPADPILSFEVVPGGRAKETARIALRPNGVLPTRIILRRDFARDTTGTRSSAEFPLLDAVHRAGSPVPRPLLAEADPAILGGTFLIVEDITDARRLGELFPELNDFSGLDRAFGEDFAAALASIHKVRDAGVVAEMRGHHSGTTPHDAVRGFHAMWRSLPKPPFSLATEMGFAWLLGTPLPAERPSTLVHGDVGSHNLLVRDGRLAAILDWELAHIGDPAEDIGYVRATMIDPLVPWERFVRRYVAAGGSAAACDGKAVDWFSVWGHVRNSVYVTMFRDWAQTGERTDIETINAGWDFHARTQRYIARELHRALGGAA